MRLDAALGLKAQRGQLIGVALVIQSRPCNGARHAHRFGVGDGVLSGLAFGAETQARLLAGFALGVRALRGKPRGFGFGGDACLDLRGGFAIGLSLL